MSRTNPELAIKELRAMRWDWRVTEDEKAFKLVFTATKQADDGQALRVVHEQSLGRDDEGYYHPMTKLALKAEAMERACR